MVKMEIVESNGMKILKIDRKELAHYYYDSNEAFINSRMRIIYKVDGESIDELVVTNYDG